MPLFRRPKSAAAATPSRSSSGSLRGSSANVSDDVSVNSSSTVVDAAKSNCPACGRAFDSGKRLPIAVDSCGHVICRKCSGAGSLRQSRRNRCPVCEAAKSRDRKLQNDFIRPSSVAAVPTSVPTPAASNGHAAASGPSTTKSTTSFSLRNAFVPIRSSEPAGTGRRKLPDLPPALQPQLQQPQQETLSQPATTTSPTNEIISSQSRVPAAIRPASAAAVTTSGRRLLPTCPEETAAPVVSDSKVDYFPGAVSHPKSDQTTRRPGSAAASGDKSGSSGLRVGRVGQADLGFEIVRSSVSADNNDNGSARASTRRPRGEDNDVTDLAIRENSVPDIYDVSSSRGPSTTLDFKRLYPPAADGTSQQSSTNHRPQSRPVTSLDDKSTANIRHLQQCDLVQTAVSSPPTSLTNHHHLQLPLAPPVGQNRPESLTPTPLPTLFRRSHWRQSLRDDATASGVKGTSTSGAPGGRISPAAALTNYFQRRQAAGDVILSSLGTMFKRPSQAAGDGVSSLVSNKSRDTGYSSIGTTPDDHLFIEGESAGGKLSTFGGCLGAGSDAHFSLRHRSSVSDLDLGQSVRTSSNVHLLTGSDVGAVDIRNGIDDSESNAVPPPPADVARDDLLTRLSLLLGPDITGPTIDSSSTIEQRGTRVGGGGQFVRSISSPAGNMPRLTASGHRAVNERRTTPSTSCFPSEVPESATEGATEWDKIITNLGNDAGSSLSITFNPTFSPGGSTGREPSTTDSVTSLVSSSTGTGNSSVSPASTWRLPAPPTTVSPVHSTTSSHGYATSSLQRPRSVNAQAAAARTGNDTAAVGPLGIKRKSIGRMSARSFGVAAGARNYANGTSGSGSNSMATTPHSDYFSPIVRQQLHLTKIDFQVVHRETTTMSPIFVGRDWLFNAIEQSMADQTRNGVLVVSSAGCGKTALVEHLVDISCFGEEFGCSHQDLNTSADGSQHSHNGKGRPPPPASATLHGSVSSLQSPRSSMFYNAPSTSSLTSSSTIPRPGNGIAATDTVRRLASRLVAFHYCQADNIITCQVPEFVHSLAAHLAAAPQLTAYRDLLISRPSLQAALTIRQCVIDPSRAFIDGVIAPLTELFPDSWTASPSGQEQASFFIAVDGLNESEFHEPDYGGTITSFLLRHIVLFPPCLRLLVTTRPGLSSETDFPLSRISLDENIEAALRDVSSYVVYRIATSGAIQANIEQTGSSNSSGSSSGTGTGNSFRPESHDKLAAYLAKQSSGCMLYAKLVLDLIERGSLVLKSAGYRVIPINLGEVYQLEMSLRFATTRAFERATPVLAVCLASLFPLTATEIKDSVLSRYVQLPRGVLADLERHLEMLSDGLLVRRRDGTFAFFHPTFREWLIRREQDVTATKFVCDVRLGHALLAFKLSRLDAPLSPERVIELGHHVLKAHIHKSHQSSASPVPSRDLHAYWLCLCTESLSAALVYHRNLYSPNIMVSRLLLLAGANANARTDTVSSSPALHIASRYGYTDVVSMLTDFGADVNAVDENLVPALSEAARGGHVGIIHLLTSRGARVSQTDSNGWCPLVHAAANNQLDAVHFLLQQCDWSFSRDHRSTRNDALHQALVAASRAGHATVCQYLVSLQKVPGNDGFNINASCQLFGETALTAACHAGHLDVVLTLLNGGANVVAANSAGLRPLLCAAEAGNWRVVDALLGTDHASTLLGQTDKNGRSALMLASAEGHLNIVDLLLSKGASLTTSDRDGWTALSWACMRGHLQCCERLLSHGSDINHTDKNHRTPLHLASTYGHGHVVQCLLDRDANMEVEDVSDTRPLDRAISCRHPNVVVCFLRKGAKLGPSTWAMAAGKPDIMSLLLNKLFDDGNILYKKCRLRDAAYRYQYALKKLPKSAGSDDVTAEDTTFSDLRVNLMLNLSRCKRKLYDTSGAIELATSVLEQRPACWEAYYARARAERDERQYNAAIEDLNMALSLAPNNGELHRLLARIQDEVQRYQSDTALLAMTSQSGQLLSQDNGSSTDKSVKGNDCGHLPGNSSRHSGIPDIVSETVSGGSVELERFKEETAL